MLRPRHQVWHAQNSAADRWSRVRSGSCSDHAFRSDRLPIHCAIATGAPPSAPQHPPPRPLWANCDRVHVLARPTRAPNLEAGDLAHVLEAELGVDLRQPLDQPLALGHELRDLLVDDRVAVGVAEAGPEHAHRVVV